MTDLSKIINGLQPNANYTVQVRSKNSDGQYSDWSNTYSFNTPSATLNTTNSVVVQQLAGGLLFSGDPLLDQGTQPYILISQDGIQGGQGGDLAFALPTGSGQQPTIGAFQIQRTDLVLPSTFTISNIPVVAGRKYFYLPQTYASSVSYGMLVSDNLSRIPANTYVTAVRATSNAASISVAISSSIVTSGNSNITFRAPGAKFRVGTSASNSITIQGPNAGGILDTPASIFTTINGVSTSSNSGAGFYLDETGKFRFAGSAGYISTDGSGNLTVSGSITATSGSIGGFLISSDRLSSSVSTSQYVAVSGSGDYAFWAGNATASAAPFWVKNDGTSKVTGIQIGNVGGFTITSSALWGGTSPNIIGLDPTNATYSIFAGATASTGAGAKFWVTNSGSIYATAASFNGSIINSGSLTGTSNNSGSLVGGAILVPNTTTPLFKVDSSGNMTASNAYLSGSIVSNSGSIGGWQINTGSLTSGTGASAVGLTTGNYAIYAGNATASAAPFSVTNTGVLTATGANISGTLNATTGSIGGFAITGSALYGGSSGSITGLNPYNASATIFAGSTSSAGDNAKFWVSNSGSVFATAASMSGPVLSTAVMTGTISASTANFQLSNSGSITGGNITIPATGTPKFTVDSSGNMVAQSASITGFISASSGSVGGWSITTGSLTSGTTASTVGLTTGTYAIYAGNATASLAPFSVTNTGVLNASNANISGSISATSGSIGGFQINNSNLSATGIVLSSSSGLNLGSGQFTVSQAGAMVAQTASITGQISASSGNIAGWTLTGQEIGTGTGANRVALNSTGSPKIYIGYGNYGTGDTGFYVDSAGYFSLGNQLTFAPGKGTASIITTPTIFVNGSASVTTAYNNSSSIIIPGTLVTASSLPTGVRVASVSFGASATASLTYTSNFSGTINTTFQSDNLSLLTVNGTIRGAVDSITPISSPTLFATVTSASVSAASTVLLTASGGHFFSPSTVVIFSGLTSTNGLNLLNYAASAGNAYSIISIPNSTQFIINSGSLAITAGNIPSASSGRASIQQLTMGLHPAMNTGTSWANNTGTGVRLDDYNWWLVNNQFRVGNPLSYLKYDGTQFRLQGGGDKTLIMQVGAANSANQFSITASSNTSGNYNSADTPFYVDGTGRASLGTGLVWTGSVLSIVGSASISGSVVANSGTIAGWTIQSGSLIATGASISGTGGLALGSPAKFTVDTSGNMVANSASISGSIVSSAGNIGGWSISSSALSSSNVGLYAPVSPSATDIAIFAGSAIANRSTAPFRVDYSGNLTATNANISGSINATSGSFSGQITASSGSVGGWAIGNNSLSSGSITLFSGSGSSPAQIYVFNSNLTGRYSSVYSNTYSSSVAGYGQPNTPFYVDSTGKFSLGGGITWDGASALTITGTVNSTNGNIGGWNISSSALTSSNVGLYAPTSPGSSEVAFFAGAAITNRASAPFRVDNSGNFYSANANISGIINATSGNVGPVQIGSNSVYILNLQNQSPYQNFLTDPAFAYTSTGYDANYNNWTYLNPSSSIGKLIPFNQKTTASVSSFSIVGDLITVNTSSAHGLKINQVVHMVPYGRSLDAGWTNYRNHSNNSPDFDLTVNTNKYKIILSEAIVNSVPSASQVVLYYPTSSVNIPVNPNYGYNAASGWGYNSSSWNDGSFDIGFSGSSFYVLTSTYTQINGSSANINPGVRTLDSVPVLPKTNYVVSAYVLSEKTSPSAIIGIEFYDQFILPSSQNSTTSYEGQVNIASAVFLTSSTQWTRISASGTSSSISQFARVFIQELGNNTASTKSYFSGAQLEIGSSPTRLEDMFKDGSGITSFSQNNIFKTNKNTYDAPYFYTFDYAGGTTFADNYGNYAAIYGNDGLYNSGEVPPFDLNLSNYSGAINLNTSTKDAAHSGIGTINFTTSFDDINFWPGAYGGTYDYSVNFNSGINGVSIGSWKSQNTYTGLMLKYDPQVTSTIKNYSYLLMTNGLHTYISSASTGSVYIRPNSNATTNQISVAVGQTTVTGGLTVTAGADNIYLYGTGATTIGIGYNASSSAQLIYLGYGTTTANSNTIRSGAIVNTTTANAANMYIDATNLSLYRSTSSFKVKTNIAPLYNFGALSSTIPSDKILNSSSVNISDALQIVPVSFTSELPDDSNKSFLGFIAEDVAEKVPSLATYDPDGSANGYSSNGMIAVLWALIQEQQVKIDQLSSSVAFLASKLP